jgi:hypothetical protein
MSALPSSVRSLSRRHAMLTIAVSLVIGLWLANLFAGWFDRLFFSVGALLAIVVAGLLGDRLWNRFRDAWVDAEVAKGAPRGEVGDRFYREYEE